MALTQSIEIAADFITILVLDLKGEFGDIPDLLGRDRWLYFDPEDSFRLGWNPPYKCRNYNGWINNLTKVICSASDLKFSEAVIAAVIIIAFNLLNTPLVSPVIFPSPLLIEQLLTYLPSNMITTKQMYLESALHKIRYLRRIAGNLFEAESGFDIFKHLIDTKKCAVVNCSKLNPILIEILINILSLQFNFTKISLKEISQQTTYILAVDEGDTIASKETAAKYPEGYSEYARGFKQMRAFGGMNILGLTSYAKCDPIITANTTNYFILNQADPDSIYEASKTIIEPDSMQLISSLPCGHAIYKETMGQITYGLPIKIDLAPTSLPTGSLDRHTFTEARGINDIPGFKEKLDELIGRYKSASLNQSKAQKNTEEISKTERVFLDHLSLKDYEPIHVIFSRIGDSSAGSQQQIVDNLEKIKFIETIHARTGKIFIRFAGLTIAAKKYLNKPVEKDSIRGDKLHRCICYLKRDFDIKKGAEKTIFELQYPGSSGFADVGSYFNGKLYATEVVITDSNICHHVKSCFIDAAGQVETLTIISLLKSEHQKILKKIMSVPELVFFINRINFMTLEDILKELYQ